MATNKDLGTADVVTSALKTDYVLITVNGSVRRMTVENLMNSLNSGDDMLLRQVAWGVPILQDQTSQAWGIIGNTTMRTEYESKCGRYLVSNTGIAAKLSRVDSSVFADGTTLDESKGHVMFIAPRLYYRVTKDATTNVSYLWLSQLPIGAQYIGTCHNNEYVAIGAYNGAVVNSALVSRSSQALYITGATIESFWNMAQKNGTNWGLCNYDHVRFMAMLGIGHYGNPNIQSQLGYGLCGSGSSTWEYAKALTTGATKSLGDAWARVDVSLTGGTNCSHVNMGGVENWYGWQWNMIQGIYCGSSGNSANGQTGSEVYIYKGNRIPTSAELTTHPVGDYRQITRSLTTLDGYYVISMLLGDYFDLFPTKIGGSADTYWGDGAWARQNGQLVSWGGGAYICSPCGLACCHSQSYFSYSVDSFGSRLAYYGQLTFVNGKQFVSQVA
jgi:hypothetical protein